MVVDDDVDTREAMCAFLEMEGHQVDSAPNGQEALQRLRAAPALPCLIFLDLMMPVMDGYEFRAQQLGDPALAGIPVVVVSAGSLNRPALTGTEFMKKPLDPNRLLARIDKLACAHRASP